MLSTRISYEEWLKLQGVVGKSENSDVAAYKTKAVINYLFDNSNDAERFAKTFNIKSIYLNNQVVYPDSFTGKLAVVINDQDHQALQEEYKKYLKNLSRSSVEIQNQLSEINQRLDFIKNQSTLADGLTKLHSLARNESEGWTPEAAANAFHQSFKNYIALNMHRFNPKEIALLKNHAQLIHHDKANGISGVMQEFNWRNKLQDDHMRSLTSTPEKMRKNIRLNTFDLLNGTTNRKAIKAKFGLLAYTRGTIALSDSKKSREMLRFFPDENGKSETDVIYLNTGRADHTTITKIWKCGIDENGYKVKEGQQPHHFDFFETEYNAGAGSEWAANAFHIAGTDQITSGVLWTASTKHISSKECESFTPGTAGHNKAMYDALNNLITAEHMLGLYTPPKIGNTKDSEDGWTKWKNQRDSHLSPRIDYLSKMGVPQRSGNCIAMSWKVMTDDHIGNLSEEHWLHVKTYDKNSIQEALSIRREELQTELQELKDKGLFFDAPNDAGGAIEKVAQQSETPNPLKHTR